MASRQPDTGAVLAGQPGDRLPGPGRWRKKPVEVDAIQWTGSNVAEVLEFAGGGYFDTVPPEDRAEDPDMTAEVYDKLHGTWVHVYDGQWIIRGIQGECYPCAADVFAATYEPAGETGAPAAAAKLASVRETVTTFRTHYAGALEDQASDVICAVLQVLDRGEIGSEVERP